MSDTLRHYGWPVSPYTAKTRSFLRFKGIAFDDRVPSLFGLKRIQGAVGKMIMPTVELPDGTWLQDSSDIIDTLEALHPNPCTVPSGITQRLACLLLELHGDEWLPMVALHYRWNVEDNARFAMKEFARCGIPWLPAFLGQPLVRRAAAKMQSYLPVHGVTEESIPRIEALARDLIADLNVHLADHRFVLGDRPCLGDFALFGPLWAHLFRDPGSTALFDDAPHVRQWMERLRAPCDAPGPFLPNDEVPATLDPIFRRVFRDQLAWVTTLVSAIDAYCADHPDATRVPRALGTAPFQVGGFQGQRKLVTFVQWKAQRPWAVYQQASPQDQAQLAAWMGRFSESNPLAVPIQHPFERHEFRMRLA